MLVSRNFFCTTVCYMYVVVFSRHNHLPYKIATLLTFHAHTLGIKVYWYVKYCISAIRRRPQIIAAPPDMLNEIDAALQYWPRVVLE